MSLGSISTEAHATLAIAMNRIGGKVKHRRGAARDAAATSRWLGRDAAVTPGQASRRTTISGQSGDDLRSKIKQVASGRFGVTAEYLCQRRPDPDQDGAGRKKPGEGGQLPGHKVSEYIANCASRCRVLA